MLSAIYHYAKLLQRLEKGCLSLQTNYMNASSGPYKQTQRQCNISGRLTQIVRKKGFYGLGFRIEIHSSSKRSLGNLARQHFKDKLEMTVRQAFVI